MQSSCWGQHLNESTLDESGMCYVFSISKPQNPRQTQTQIQAYFGAAQNYQTNPRLRFDSDTIFKIPFTTKAGWTSSLKEPGAGGTEPTPKGIASAARRRTLGAPAPRLGRARSPAWSAPAGAGGRLGPSNFRKKRARPAAARPLKPPGAPGRRAGKREGVGGRSRGLPASPRPRSSLPPPLREKGRSPPPLRTWSRAAALGRASPPNPRSRSRDPELRWKGEGGRPSRLRPPPAPPYPWPRSPRSTCCPPPAAAWPGWPGAARSASAPSPGRSGWPWRRGWSGAGAVSAPLGTRRSCPGAATGTGGRQRRLPQPELLTAADASASPARWLTGSLVFPLAEDWGEGGWKK